MTRKPDAIEAILEQFPAQRASVAHKWSGSANTEDYEELDIPFNDFVAYEVDFYIESDASSSVKVRLEHDRTQNALAPVSGWMTGGGAEMRAWVGDYLPEESIRAHWDNGDSSSREFQVVVHGWYVE